MKYVAYDGLRFRCYLSDTGRGSRYLGCFHETPRQAAAHTAPVYVSPTRSVSPSYPSSATGHAAGGGLTEGPESAGTEAPLTPRSLPPATGDHIGR